MRNKISIIFLLILFFTGCVSSQKKADLDTPKETEISSDEKIESDVSKNKEPDVEIIEDTYAWIDNDGNTTLEYRLLEFKEYTSVMCDNSFYDPARFTDGEKVVVAFIEVENLSNEPYQPGNFFGGEKLKDANGKISSFGNFNLLDDDRAGTLSCYLKENNYEIPGFTSPELLPGETKKYAIFSRTLNTESPYIIKVTDSLFVKKSE